MRKRSTQKTPRQRPRRAKIARLPKAIRAEIIRRLDNGHSQRSVVKWINGQRSVRAALRREQSGTAKMEISARNLSTWLSSQPTEAANLHLQ